MTQSLVVPPSISPDRDALELSHDSLLGGRVVFEQPRRGYRVNVDSVLLASFADSGRRAALAVDLGAGIGLVALLLAQAQRADEFWLVERDRELARIAERNLCAATVKHRLLVQDVADRKHLLELKQAADLVVCNPPFFSETQHRAPRDPDRERARLGDVRPFMETAAYALSGSKARAFFAYPAPGLPELLSAAESVKLVAKRLRLVHPFRERPARLVLVELRRARPGGLIVEPALIEWERPGLRSQELCAITLDPTSDRK